VTAAFAAVGINWHERLKVQTHDFMLKPPQRADTT
jgi:hypothetical protein